jgi:YesN/AraC family two-component response regulator
MYSNKKTLKFLIVDDAIFLRAMLNNILSVHFENAVITTAINGEDALDNYHDEFDLVITDIVMPKMDGIELSKKIKEKKPNQKIVASTSLANASFLKKFPFDEVIIKNFNENDVVKTIDDVLNEKTTKNPAYLCRAVALSLTEKVKEYLKNGADINGVYENKKIVEWIGDNSNVELFKLFEPIQQLFDQENKKMWNKIRLKLITC